MKRYYVHICDQCGEQQWYAGTCSDCSGTVRTYSALLADDIRKFGEQTAEISAPIPKHFIGEFVVSLLQSSLARQYR